ncbi:FHA domain-containing protein [Dokdonella sp.]|uniref:FHA domain-containing protein n=1 Tax=Dokdonella sp. TaxID=2291710 RepID=UPI002F40A563
MPARLTAYPPDGAALVRVLEEGTAYRVGRASACELRIEHPSVSRFHAELEWKERAWLLSDTGSKNGMRVDGHMVRSSELAVSTWFSIGDVQCSFEPIDAEAVAAHRSAGLSRREISRALSSQLRQPNVGMSTLIPQMLDMVLQLSGLDRGFVLYADAGQPLRVHASRALRHADFSGDRFAGSAAAVERALASRKSVVCCDTSDSPWLAQRPSVRLGGIRAVICTPLLMQDGSRGAIYADSRAPGPPVTELDLELVENVAGAAATALEAARLRDRISGLIDALPDGDAPLWQELRKVSA